jgi:hypothetical protein
VLNDGDLASRLAGSGSARAQELNPAASLAAFESEIDKLLRRQAEHTVAPLSEVA